MPEKMTLTYALIVLNRCNTDGRIKVDRQELKEAIKLIHKEIIYRIPRKLEKDDVDKFLMIPEIVYTFIVQIVEQPYSKMKSIAVTADKH